MHKLGTVDKAILCLLKIQLHCKNTMLFWTYSNGNSLKSVSSFVHLHRQSMLIGTK